MAMDVSIRHVAEHAGVSIGTASRVLNGYSNVDAKIAEKVRASIIALNYRPNHVAQSLRGNKTRTIGIVVRDLTATPIGAYVTAAQDILVEAGYALFVASTGGDPRRDRMFIKLLAERRVDGMIAAVGNEHLQFNFTAPLILLDRDQPANADAVLINHSQGITSSIEYLVGLGHERIAIVTGRPDSYPAINRIQGFEAAMRRHGLEAAPDFIRSDGFDPKVAFQAAYSLLSRTPRPTAIIAGGINVLPGVLRAVKTLGLSIPGDVSIIGSSDSDLAQLSTPPITILRWSFEDVGTATAQIMLDRLTKKQTSGPPQRLLFETELVVRASCAPPPTRSP